MRLMAAAMAVSWLACSWSCSEPADGADADLSDAGPGGDSGSPDAAGLPDAGRPPIVRDYPTVAVQPGGIAYWSDPYFADALAAGHWTLYRGADPTPITVEHWNNPQFNRSGLPQYLEPDTNLGAVLLGLHIGEGRAGPVTGQVVLTWVGKADIRLTTGEFDEESSSGPATGVLENGRRVYRYAGDGAHLRYLRIYAIDTSQPLEQIHAWLPDPADPTRRSLEGQLFHPLFLSRLRDRDWGVIRFMDWGATNSSPVVDWSDRRPGDHIFQAGILNPRPTPFAGEQSRETGASYERMIQLCNTIDTDLWINVPHMATDDFIGKLARLIRYGSDGVEPYDEEVSDPVFEPLNSNRRVYVEYSNEAWNWSFAQGHWAEQEAAALGISRAQFNARRSSEVWSIFQRELGVERLVRTAAIWASRADYTQAYLEEARDYGRTLSPSVEPDIVAPTTYFGNSIENWVFAQEWLDGREGDEAYWRSAEHEQHLEMLFDEWSKRMLSGSVTLGAGPDATGIGGGFLEQVHELARTTFDTPRPLVAYEGGPSIYTNRFWGVDAVRGPLLTRFMNAANRHPRMADVYRIHLNMSLSHGLATHTAFNLVGRWSRWGQWGHLESLDQEVRSAPKYQFLLDWADEAERIALVDRPSGEVPSFLSPGLLDAVEVGEPVDLTLEATGGDGELTVTVQGDRLVEGLSAEPGRTPGTIRVFGTPVQDEESYIFARVVDADGDPAWRTFALLAYGGDAGLIHSRLRGTNPAQHLPWADVFYRASTVMWSGWQAGVGIRPQEGDDGLFFSSAAPADEPSSTLGYALEHDAYWTATITPNAGATLDLRDASVLFTIERIDYHSPRRIAFMTSVGGFSEGSEVFVSLRNENSDTREYRFQLPTGSEYSEISGPLELRIVVFGGQYAGHVAVLRGFKIHQAR